MAEAGENFAAFNSRALVEMVGGVTDEALKATRIKKFLGVLAGRYFNWAGRKSLFTLHLGIKCCAIEMAAAATPRFDGDRFGVLFRSSPRQSDVLLINGPITKKFADKVVRLWEQMPEPKYCIAMGECAISGGPYFQSYNILEGVDTVIPVDVYMPGCPPRPEALIDGFGLLREKIIRIGGAPSADRMSEKPVIVGEDWAWVRASLKNKTPWQQLLALKQSTPALRAQASRPLWNTTATPRSTHSFE